jgi:hypothetical protein
MGRAMSEIRESEAMSDGSLEPKGGYRRGSRQVPTGPRPWAARDSRTGQAGRDGRPQVTSQRGVHPHDPGQGVADRVGHVLPSLLVTSREFPGSPSEAIRRRQLATDELHLVAHPRGALGSVDLGAGNEGSCPHCGGRLRLIGTLYDPAIIRNILADLRTLVSRSSPSPAPPECGAAAS